MDTFENIWKIAKSVFYRVKSGIYVNNRVFYNICKKWKTVFWPKLLSLQA